MASFGSRKAPNVSHYLSNLNAIPSEHDIATQQPEDFNFSDDLAAFTNAEFFDLDQGEHVFQSPVDYDHSNQTLTGPDAAVAPGETKSGDFGMSSPAIHVIPQQRRRTLLASLRAIMTCDQQICSH